MNYFHNLSIVHTVQLYSVIQLTVYKISTAMLWLRWQDINAGTEYFLSWAEENMQNGRDKRLSQLLFLSLFSVFCTRPIYPDQSTWQKVYLSIMLTYFCFCTLHKLCMVVYIQYCTKTVNGLVRRNLRHGQGKNYFITFGKQ